MRSSRKAVPSSGSNGELIHTQYNFRSLNAQNIIELLSRLPEEERIITDVLRHIILSAYPDYIKEKISYNVPFFYANKGIAIIWPASVPRGGIKNGVLLGFWYGNKLKDIDRYLEHGTNKQVFYKVFKSADEIHDRPILKLLAEAIKLDKSLKAMPGRRRS